MPIGLTPTGFATETIDEIKAAMVADLQSRIGSTLDLTDGSTIGSLLSVISDLALSCNELAQAVYNAGNAETAVGDALVNQCALTGTTPLPPTPSTVVLTLTGLTGTVIPVVRQAETIDGVVFETTEPALLVVVPPWTPSTTYVVGNRRALGGDIYQCTVGGAVGLIAGPSGQGQAITVGPTTWRWLGTGTGVDDVVAVTVANGPLAALSNTVTLIKTPVSGWQGVTNLLDADLGRLEEPDESLRLRRAAELAGAGSHSVNALRADLLSYLEQTQSTKTQATIFQNVTDTTDVDGMPPHTVECLIRGGDSQTIADLLLNQIGVGYATTGNQTLTSIDSQGFSHVIKFSRPVEKLIYATLQVVVDTATFPSDGVLQIQKAIIAFGDAQNTGRDAVASQILAQAFKVAGVLDVPICYIGLTPSPASSTTIPIALRQLAVHDTSRIVVTTSTGTP
jgi:uncharacterized phage protein gp47/JayE